MTDNDGCVDRVDIAAYTVPTDAPKADGTLSWDATTIVVADVGLASGVTGVGYTYGHRCVADLIRDVLADLVVGRDVRDPAGAWEAMVGAIRNQGRPGIASMAIAAVDTAIWDAKARLLGQPLHRLFGAIRDAVPVYGSGGFTTYSTDRLVDQLAGWVRQGIPRVKLKIGVDRDRSPDVDLERVRAARAAIGESVELYVDANGAFDRSRARWVGRRLADEADVAWFEEPVSSDDLDGLAQLARELPMDVTAGEYGYDLAYFARMLPAVDVIQPDVTRCAGYTELLRIAAVADAAYVPLSPHCAPALHAPIATSLRGLRHVEYFHDHGRIERMLFDGVPELDGGCLCPSDAPGNGLAFRAADAEAYRVA